MRRTVQRLVIVLAAATWLHATPAGAFAGASEEPFDIFWAGNSHTRWYTPAQSGRAVAEPGVPKVVRLLAEFTGRPSPRYEWSVLDGSGILVHAVDAPAFASLRPEGEWDFIVLQGNAQENLPLSTGLGNPSRFQSGVRFMDESFRAHSPGVTTVLYQTWARAAGHGNYAAQGGPIADPAAFHAFTRGSYHAAYREVLRRGGAERSRLARVGDAFADNGWNADQGSATSLISGDFNHVNSRGGLVCSLVIFAAIYGERDLASLAVDLEHGTSELEVTLRQRSLDQADWDYAAALADAQAAKTQIGCTAGDVAFPAGVHDVNDVVEFVNAFVEAGPAGDRFPEPDGDGVLSMDDVVTFVNAFTAGCGG